MSSSPLNTWYLKLMLESFIHQVRLTKESVEKYDRKFVPKELRICNVAESTAVECLKREAKREGLKRTIDLYFEFLEWDLNELLNEINDWIKIEEQSENVDSKKG